MMICRADAAADPADIAGKSGQYAAGPPQTVGMIPFVGSAPAPGDDCGTAGGVLFCQLHDYSFGNLRDLGGPGRCVLFGMLPQCGEHSLQFHAACCKISFQLRRNAGCIVGLERARVLIPYLELAV